MRERGERERWEKKADQLRDRYREGEKEGDSSSTK